MNLADLTVTATVHFDPTQNEDRLVMNGQPASGGATGRVFDQLDLIRTQAAITTRAMVTTASNFPTGAGVASSAAAFSALAVAGAAAAGLNLSEAELSVLARRGSGSACRSIPTGYCQWSAGGTDQTAYATSIAPPEHWALCDLVAIVSTEHKQVTSSGGHQLADTSVLQAGRVASARERFAACKAALLDRNLAALGPIIEEDAIIMHSIMMRTPSKWWCAACQE
jgi:diphosphomevalonate decarboxylase